MNKKDSENINVVFEYSYSNQTFDANLDKHRKLVEYIYDRGVENYSINAMNTDTNVISKDLSREFMWLFYVLEKNKGIFLQYCDHLVDNKLISVTVPDNEEIANDQKKLTEYYNREVFVIVALQLLERLLKMNFAPLLKKSNHNETTIEVYNKYLNYRFDVESSQLKSLGKDFIKKLSMPSMLDMVDLPNKIRFECAVPAFCLRMMKSELDMRNLDKILDLFNYQIGLA